MGYVLIRNQGKLPAPTARASYALKYGRLNWKSRDALGSGLKVVVVDCSARHWWKHARRLLSCRLRLLECVSLVELTSPKGREKLGGCALLPPAV